MKRNKIQEEIKNIIDNMSEKDKMSMMEDFSNAKESLIKDEIEILNSLQKELSNKTKFRQDNWNKMREMPYSDEKSKMSDLNMSIAAEIKTIKQDILHQKNIAKAVSNGGSFIEFTDKKGRIQTKVADFRKIESSDIFYDEDTIATSETPLFIPIIDEDTYKSKGYIFDAIRYSEDTYLVSVEGYRRSIGDDESNKNNFIILTLDQLVLTIDYYKVKAKAKLIQDAVEQTKRNEEYYDRLPKEKRERHFNQVGYYERGLPAKIRKTISKEKWESLDLEGKEVIYKPFQVKKSKRMKAPLEANKMWTSFHKMYERFINPNAIMPKPRTANTEVWGYWIVFRDRMDYKIKDINMQRADLSESYKQAIETSFGSSNTNDSILDSQGLLVKRQNGKNINEVEIYDIEKSIISIQNVYGSLKGLFVKYGMKISHTGKKLVFASKAVGSYIKSMNTIAVSMKYGEMQFDLTLSHELGHFIDASIGELRGKRFATDDYESKEGLMAFEFRRLMNKGASEQSDYINSTKECFARAFEQYYSMKKYGRDGELGHSYTELDGGMKLHAVDHFVDYEVFEKRIKPLIDEILNDNRDLIPVQEKQEVKEIKTEPTKLETLIKGLEILLKSSSDNEKSKYELLIKGLNLIK